MKVKINTGIHNRFDVEVRDAKTGALKQKAVAFNIVLDAMWSRLVNRQVYFTNIHFGTGSGTLASSRTTLFSWLGQKTAVNDTQVKDLPTSSWKQKIVLNPEEFVGSEITEVGIAYDSTASHILTHALLQDAEGNPISIVKLATDIVTIYATIFCTFSTGNSKILICSMPENTNPLINYLIGSSTAMNTLYFYTGHNMRPGGKNTRGLIGGTVFKSAYMNTFTTDVANKRFSTPVMRLAVGDSNAHLTEICLGDTDRGSIARLELPFSGYTGMSVSAVSLGSGDGVTDTFILPSRNVDLESLIIKLDGVETTAFTATKEDYIEYIGPIRQNSADGFSLPNENDVGDTVRVYSALQKMIVNISGSGNPGNIYKYEDGGWIIDTDVPIMPADGLNIGTLSSDGLIFVRGTSISPYFRSYDKIDNVWVERSQPTNTLSTKAPSRVIMSADGSTVILVEANKNVMAVTFKWSGSEWIQYPIPASRPGWNYFGYAQLSDDGLVFSIRGAGSGSSEEQVYRWENNTWVSRASYGSEPYITLIRHTVDGFLRGNGTLYTWNGSAYVSTRTPPVSGIAHYSISEDATYLVASSSGTVGYLYVWKWNGTAWENTGVNNYNSGLTGNIIEVSGFINDELIIVISGSLYLFLIDCKSHKNKIVFNTPPALNSAITADYTVDGIHKTNQYVIDLQATIQFGEPT